MKRRKDRPTLEDEAGIESLRKKLAARYEGVAARIAGMKERTNSAPAISCDRPESNRRKF
jgi:hypothetical protein